MHHDQYMTDRVFRCAASNYREDEILSLDRTHTTEQLEQIARAGFNGIWLHGILRDLAPGPLFDKYITDSDERIRQLSSLCERARNVGLGVWVYFTEPKALEANHPFWQEHSDLQGTRTDIDFALEGSQYALCPSTGPVQQFLADGFRTVLSQVPLTGIMLITASEHPSHCWAHVMANSKKLVYAEPFWHDDCPCPRCKPRGPLDVVVQVVGTVCDAAANVRPECKVVAWDWSWNLYLEPPYQALIDKLPASCILMGDFERGGVVKRAGTRRLVEEYSLAFPGPGRRFAGEVANNAAGSGRGMVLHARQSTPPRASTAGPYRGGDVSDCTGTLSTGSTALQQGGCTAPPHSNAVTPRRRTMWAKLQINTTHELASVPNMPLMTSLYRKFAFLHKNGVAGIMASWNFGLCPDTLNVFAVDSLTRGRWIDDEQQWMQWLAAEYFGSDVDADSVTRAWSGFAAAMRHYPIGDSNFLLYFWPANQSLAYPLRTTFTGVPMQPSWLPFETIGDRLEDTAVSYSLEEIASLTGKVATGWRNALKKYRVGLKHAAHHQRRDLELGVAEVIGAMLRSTHNIYRWYLLRKPRQDQPIGPEERAILQDELDTITAALPYVRADRRLGYHQEAQFYMFDADTMQQKIDGLRKLL